MAALEMTAEQAGVELAADDDKEAVAAQLRQLPAHPKVAGAARGGLRHRLVARPGKVLDPLVERPGIVGADVAEVAEAILAVHCGGERRALTVSGGRRVAAAPPGPA
jgi:hypothetical protein